MIFLLPLFSIVSYAKTRTKVTSMSFHPLPTCPFTFTSEHLYITPVNVRVNRRKETEIHTADKRQFPHTLVASPLHPTNTGDGRRKERINIWNFPKVLTRKVEAPLRRIKWAINSTLSFPKPHHATPTFVSSTFLLSLSLSLSLSLCLYYCITTHSFYFLFNWFSIIYSSYSY